MDRNRCDRQSTTREPSYDWTWTTIGSVVNRIVPAGTNHSVVVLNPSTVVVVVAGVVVVVVVVVVAMGQPRSPGESTLGQTRDKSSPPVRSTPSGCRPTTAHNTLPSTLHLSDRARRDKESSRSLSVRICSSGSFTRCTALHCTALYYPVLDVDGQND